MTRRVPAVSGLTAAVVTCLTLSAATLAGAPPLSAAAASGSAWDQSKFILTLEADITSNIVANDFTVADYTYLLSADVWLSDAVVNDNGLLDGFAGELWWVMFSDGGATPGVALRSGRAAAVVQQDTGLQTVAGSDVVRVHFELQFPVSLAPGTYWFAMHEGPFGSTDGTAVRWLAEFNDTGALATFAVNSSSPFPWAATVDPAMVLYGGALLTSSFETSDLPNLGQVLADVIASDFFLDGPMQIRSIDVFLADSNSNDNGVLDAFGGQLGWGIYSEQSFAPGVLYASGTVTPRLLDSLFTTAGPGGGDVVRARLRLPESELLLFSSGWYWLAIHEGAWGSGNDGTPIWWNGPNTPLGHPAHHATATPNPGGWTPDTGDTTMSFFDDLLFASGFEAGCACAWSVYPTGVCP